MTTQRLVPGMDILKAGRQVISDGQLWTIDSFTSTEVVLTRPNMQCSGSVSKSVGWTSFLSVNDRHNYLFDQDAAQAWSTWGPADRLRWHFRACVVNLVLTGYHLGHPDLAYDGEPLIEPILPSEAMPPIAPRAATVSRALNDNRHLDWVQRLLWASQGTNADLASDRDLSFPAGRTISTWVHNVKNEGIWALRDGRRGRSGGKVFDRERRRSTEDLADEVVRGNRTLSKLSNDVQYQMVKDLAQAKGVEILGRTQTLTVVADSLRVHGKTPAQKKSKDFHDSRGTRSNIRCLYPGSHLAYDATRGNNLVVERLGGTPFRPWVVAVWDVATGACVAIFATGHYRQIDVQMALHDAMRPLWVTPSGLYLPARLKGHPERIEVVNPDVWDMTLGVIKPGAIPRVIRADNAKQHSGYNMLLTLNTFGVDFSPSRKGRSTDNANAESGFAALTDFWQTQPQYVGNNPGERGNMDQPHALLSVYNANLQEHCFLKYNMRPSGAPIAGRPGGTLTRLEHWDTMVQATGQMPVLTDPNAYFAFKAQQMCTRTMRGIRLDGQTYSSQALHEFGRSVVDREGHVRVWSDPRDLSCIWVYEPDEGMYYEIPNVLRDHTDQPLTNEIIQQATLRLGLRNTHNPAHRAHIAEQLEATDFDTLPVRRDLADLANATVVYGEAVRDGLRVAVSDVPASTSGSDTPAFDPYAPLLRRGARG
jgi:hypothetical protein